MTIEESKTVLTTHREHWERLLSEEICDASDGRETIDALTMAIASLEAWEKIKAEVYEQLYVDSLIFGELMDFKEGKIGADDVIEEFNRVTRLEVLQIIDKYKASPTGAESEGKNDKNNM